MPGRKAGVRKLRELEYCPLGGNIVFHLSRPPFFWVVEKTVNRAFVAPY